MKVFYFYLYNYNLPTKQDTKFKDLNIFLVFLKIYNSIYLFQNDMYTQCFALPI